MSRYYGVQLSPPQGSYQVREYDNIEHFRGNTNQYNTFSYRARPGSIVHGTHGSIQNTSNISFLLV
ncbi:hypothetical protein BofuT4_uP059140.1 [Botrytis cinerea T4]|uniref:Uncharacterized protein n=1 Tax=Botryotinia fuckeliana (strain T4) TaxID=999810 RepID=G2XV14_BOTF4|nr:hypothetical protein BofuT4_uP059140.1 [Botrytis cinerea T4]